MKRFGSVAIVMLTALVTLNCAPPKKELIPEKQPRVLVAAPNTKASQEGELPPAQYPVNLASTTNPDDVFLWIRLDQPPSTGDCYMDHPGEPPIDDELWVRLQGINIGATLKPVTYKDANDRPGFVFEVRYRDLPQSGPNDINVWLINNGGPAHSFYTYCLPGRCAEYRRCADDCGPWGTCSNQHFQVQKP
jgi:hypothetical protein